VTTPVGPRLAPWCTWCVCSLVGLSKVDRRNEIDRLIADEKLEDGTKYERLAAIVFGLLTGRATVHDLRLRGASGVRHQIDAVVGDDHTRILIETKDYDKVIGLPIIRNFWAAVEDIGPDEAFVITTVGYTKPAIQYAEAKDVRLALLRPPEEDDWAGVLRRVVIDMTMTGQIGLANITWELHPDDHEKINGGSGGLGATETALIRLADERRETREAWTFDGHDVVPRVE
jgi:hypothetical protein